MGEMLARAFRWVDKTETSLLLGVVLPVASGSACFCGREQNLRRSHPCLLQHAWTHASLCVNLCRWQLMFLPCPLQQMADFSVGYLYLRLIFPGVFYFCL